MLTEVNAAIAGIQEALWRLGEQGAAIEKSKSYGMEVLAIAIRDTKSATYKLIEKIEKFETAAMQEMQSKAGR